MSNCLATMSIMQKFCSESFVMIEMIMMYASIVFIKAVGLFF